MKAAVFRRFGPPSVLEFEQDFPQPVRRKTEVLVRIICASVNPIDWKTRKGEVPRFAVTLPKVSLCAGGDPKNELPETNSPAKHVAFSRSLRLMEDLS
jgi:NADPH:quinone reductase-like Zn-dependent oxidoreductase